jgi:3-deoxy-D-manno-octulosonate 8-phosphate phosphatase (KDO 8-P phosphatase)
MPIKAATRRKLATIRLLSLDLDGVLTDGGLYYTDAGDEMRKFDVKDGMGIKEALRRGVIVVIVTASTAPAIAHRGRQLGLEHVLLGVEDKLAAIQGLCRRLGLTLNDVAHLGDDINDLPLFAAVGLAVAVADAMPALRQAAAHVTARRGGQGAVREICDLLIETREHAALGKRRK